MNGKKVEVPEMIYQIIFRQIGIQSLLLCIKNEIALKAPVFPSLPIKHLYKLPFLGCYTLAGTFH